MGSEVQTAKMTSLSTATLFKADGSSVEAGPALEGKDLILFYFSAHWCPPCRKFTPMLAEFYKEAASLGVEVIFISRDKTEEEMFEYMKEMHGDWLAIKYKSELSESLKEKYKIEGIPTLVVMRKSDGALLNDLGEKQVKEQKPAAETIATWKSMEVKA